VIAADIRVHQSGDRFIGFGVAVIGKPLDKRTRAVADPDNPDANAPPFLKT
jgi:hypothetical protein